MKNYNYLVIFKIYIFLLVKKYIYIIISIEGVMIDMGFMFYIWIVIMVVSVIIEISTTDLTSLWFAVGAFVSLIINLFLKDDLIYVQILVFALVSIVAIFVLRPILKKKINTPKIATNVDAMIGKQVLVVSPINLNKPGIIKFEGIEWTAITEDVECEPGDFVYISKINGNTVIVNKEKKEGN